MSRRRNRGATLEQRIERAVQAEIARKFTPPAGANVQPISQNILNQMQAMQAPQEQTSSMFSPGAPIRPTPGLTPKQGPRQFGYQVGYNIASLPRSTELTSFDVLRNLASLYDGIALCLRKWFDLTAKVSLDFKPKPGLLKPGQSAGRYASRIEQYKQFFARPDKKHSLKQWMKRGLRETLTLDALAIYKHRDRAGGLYALEIIDGSTIKPLLDERGMEPDPPYPAYQQFVYGIPGMLIPADQMIYRRETERADSPYGFSRVEAIIMRVNQALRKENRDMATFTDGNTPAGFLEPPGDGTVDWTPEDLLAYQAMFDGLLSGNDAIKARIKVIPPGSKYNKTDPDDIMTPFDTFLLNVTVASFGLTMAELAFTEKVNKSSGETQEAIVYRSAMAPIMDMYAEIFTDVLETDFGEHDLMACWSGFEEPEDFKLKAEAWDILVKNGTQSTSQAAAALGLEALIETTPFIVSPTLGPVFIEDAADPALRKAQNDAKVAGYQFSQQNPGGPPQHEQEPPSTPEGSKGAMGGKTGSSGSGAKGTSGAHGAGATSAGNAPAQSHARAAPVGDTGDAAPERSEADRAYTQELRRWKEVALKRLADGKPQRSFQSLDIPAPMVVGLFDALQDASTADEIHDLFRKARAAPLDAEMIGAQPLLEYDAKLGIWEAADTDKQLARLKAQGVSHIQWNAHVSASGVCPVCAPNDGVIRAVGERFPSGHRLPQVHNHCQCAIDPVKEAK